MKRSESDDTQSDDAPICTQPDCGLRARELDTTRVAEILIKVLGGEDPKDLVPSSWRIQPRDPCVDCAARVLNGSLPLRTEEEHTRLDELGSWSRRRRRRQRR